MVVRSRRTFIKGIVGLVGTVFLFLEPIVSFWSEGWGKIKKRVLAGGTKTESLVDENPAELDVRDLEITPLNDFSTMGLTENSVDLPYWTLRVDGLVKRPFGLSYGQIRAFPAIERKVLMICPGFFANLGLWKGVSIRTLLEQAGIKPGVSHVSISGPHGLYAKTERFPLKDIYSNRIFLAYQVNGIDLPEKHGFPLRLVVEDAYGDAWIKFVDTLRAERV